MFRKRMRGEDGADDVDDPDEKKPKGAKAKKGIVLRPFLVILINNFN